MSKQLLFSLTKEDFIFETFRAGGKGGQNQNKVESGVRITHPESGCVQECRETRSQWENKQRAFERLTKQKKFRDWIRIKAARVSMLTPSPEQIEKEVDEMMNEKNLKIEYGDGKSGWHS